MQADGRKARRWSAAEWIAWECHRSRIAINTPGAGFLEKVCEIALVHELRKAGLGAARQWVNRW